MYPSIFTDELKMDFAKALPIIKSWGLEAVDLRGFIFGRAFEDLSAEQLAEAKRLLDAHGLRVGCLQSSLAKVHLPGAERQRAEERKLEGVIRAADALGCRLVRAFHYWQPTGGEVGQLAVRPDLLQQVLTMFAPWPNAPSRPAWCWPLRTVASRPRRSRPWSTPWASTSGAWPGTSPTSG